jgi:hypothetical protein
MVSNPWVKQWTTGMGQQTVQAAAPQAEAGEGARRVASDAGAAPTAARDTS